MSSRKSNSKVPKQKKVPHEYKPDHLTYDEWQIALRRQFALKQNFKIENQGDQLIYSDFDVLNPETNKIYKVAIRSEDIGINYCSCPDFTINTLGTCKHVEYVLDKLKKKRIAKKIWKNPPQQEYSSIFIKYGHNRKVMLRVGTYKSKEFIALAKQYFKPLNSSQFEYWILNEDQFGKFDQFLEKAIKIDNNFRCYRDAIDFIIYKRDAAYRQKVADFVFPEGIDSPEFDQLLKVKLYNYQKEGVLKMAKAGRSINADDMGLGKTIQAIATAEIMAREFGIEKVLIICPTSLKYQWKNEIEKFSNRDAFVLEGLPEKRKKLYQERSEFFKIITYDVVRRDLPEIKEYAPDLVILDEAQRIKNWKTKTAQAVKQVQSEYAIVCTGTPLENRLDELHSITEFVDRYKLGPLFRFLANHQILEGHKVIGYKDLHKINQTLSDILIRRTKKQVLKELPKRIDKNLFVSVTAEQKEIHDDHYSKVCRLVNKWKRFKYLSEKERQMLLVHLNCMRMVSDSTFILDQETRHDTKIAELMSLLEEVFSGDHQKVVIFSQWERMTRLVSKELEKRNIKYEYLHGGVPSPKRKDLLKNFHEDDASRVFLSTDAGGVGLNLQCASVVINLDCPWNPAVLEQRIARVYRLGQKKPVEIINFISEGTIEHSMLDTLKFKKSVFDGVLDNGKDEVFMGESKLKQFMKSVEKMTDQGAVMQDVRNTEETQKANIQSKEKLLKNKATEIKPATEKTARSVTEKDKQKSAQDDKSLDDLFSTGISFLEKLSQAVSSQDSDSENNSRSIANSFIETDQKTGQKSLKIPVPSEEVVEKAARVLSGFLEAIKKK
jgi:SNF2 family DNA or RNA helicase